LTLKNKQKKKKKKRRMGILKLGGDYPHLEKTRPYYGSEYVTGVIPAICPRINLSPDSGAPTTPDNQVITVDDIALLLTMPYDQK
jgi:hypothetical protein